MKTTDAYEEELSLPSLDGGALFDLTVTEVGDGASAFAVPSEGCGGCMSFGCNGTYC